LLPLLFGRKHGIQKKLVFPFLCCVMHLNAIK
jgi:hypothetical protein